MNKDPNTVFECMKGNKLSQNVSKTKAMVTSMKIKEELVASNMKNDP